MIKNLEKSKILIFTFITASEHMLLYIKNTLKRCLCILERVKIDQNIQFLKFTNSTVYFHAKMEK